MFNSCYAPDFLWLAFSLNSLTACVLAFLALYRFQGSLLSSELVYITTVPNSCQHLFSIFLILFYPGSFPPLFNGIPPMNAV